MDEVKALFADELVRVNAHIEAITATVTRLQTEWPGAGRDRRGEISRSLTALASGLASAFRHRGDVAEVARSLELPL